MPNTIDTGRFKEKPASGSLRTLLVLGRLHRKKRVDVALQAFACVAQMYPQVHLVLAGPDEEGLGADLLEQARLSGIEGRVHLTGLLREEHVLAALADALLLMMPSEPDSENFGMSALEAMAAGVPVLVSEGVPVGRWAEEHGAGLVVDCSVEAFACALAKLLADPCRLRAMGEAGRRLAETNFDQDRVAQKWIAQLEAIVNTGKPLPEAAPEALAETVCAC